MYPNIRMRRLRNGKIGNLIRETSLGVDDLIYPMFVDETAESIVEVPSMEGVLRLPLSEVVNEARNVTDLGISSLILFGIPSDKDEKGSSACGDEDIVQQATRAIKEELGDDMVVITDVCMCEYTSHGHCGIIDNETHDVINDETLPILGEIAASHARAGADMVAPSGMMDGMVGAIRQSLDQENFNDVPIMSYAAKYCSAFYGPFRDAADSCYCFGDRSTYQMDPANSDEALREVELDIMEGADIVMVKPALPYLDIIYRIKQEFGMPTAAYNVSGEYSMLKAAAQQGWLDDKKVMYESLMSIKRAGADMIITYFAKEMAQLMNE
jgi:porphobilinogen synthase